MWICPGPDSSQKQHICLYCKADIEFVRSCLHKMPGLLLNSIYFTVPVFCIQCFDLANSCYLSSFSFL